MRAITAIVATAVVLAAGCSSDSDDPAVPIAVNAVEIEALGCGGQRATGVGFVTDGRVVTTAHTVAGADQVMVDGNEATITAIDTEADIAVLAPADETGPSTPLAVGIEADVAVLVIIDDTVGTSLPVTVGDEVTIRITDIYDDRPTERRGFPVDHAVEPGDSGAPVVTGDGVIGMVFSRATDSTEARAWATSAAEIDAVLATADDEAAAAVACR